MMRKKEEDAQKDREQKEQMNTKGNSIWSSGRLLQLTY
jgi:hypothetical protein